MEILAFIQIQNMQGVLHCCDPCPPRSQMWFKVSRPSQNLKISSYFQNKVSLMWWVDGNTFSDKYSLIDFIGVPKPVNVCQDPCPPDNFLQTLRTQIPGDSGWGYGRWMGLTFTSALSDEHTGSQLNTIN